MLFLFLGVGLALLPILLRLAIRLRLGVPLLYATGMLTVFHSWYQAHTALADGIFFALVGLAALSWVVTAARKALDWFSGFWADRTAAARFARRVRQARQMPTSLLPRPSLLPPRLLRAVPARL